MAVRVVASRLAPLGRGGDKKDIVKVVFVEEKASIAHMVCSESPNNSATFVPEKEMGTKANATAVGIGFSAKCAVLEKDNF